MNYLLGMFLESDLAKEAENAKEELTKKYKFGKISS